jgi:dephospho-CoA kinase
VVTLVIGLTGSIATGKSTVANMFRELQIPVIDADVLAREVVEPGEKAYEEIVKHFGKEILFEDGTLNRKKLGSIVFSDAEKRKILNSIVHPEVRKKMLEKRDTYIKEKKKAVVLDIPLLFESKLTHLVDKTLVVYTDKKIQLSRLMERDKSTKENALKRIHAQMPIDEKIKLADAAINNNGSLNDTKEQLIQLLKKWDVL